MTVADQLNYSAWKVTPSRDRAEMVRQAEAWADAMEAAVNRGEKLEDVALKLWLETHGPDSKAALTNAVRVLETCWKHGNEIRHALLASGWIG